MALNKKEGIQHTIQDGCQSRNVIWTPFIRWPPSCFFQNMQSISNCIILSSYICKQICNFIYFHFFAVNHTNLPQNSHLDLENTIFVPIAN